MDPLPLSPVDYLFLGPGSQPITFALAYQSSLDHRRLQVGLESILSDFPLVRSRLGRVADCDFVFHDQGGTLDLESRESDRPFDPAEGTSPYITPVRSVENAPLARFTHTRTPSGSILATSISHALVDGFSYFHFLSSWARRCRGERFIPSSHDRRFLQKVRDLAPGSAGDEHLLQFCGLFPGGRRPDAHASSDQVERISLSGEQVRSDVEQARDSAGVPLTENDVLVAVLWKQMLEHRGAGRGETFVTCPVDFRRILPGVPKNYFGCALAFATAAFPAERLAAASVAQLAVLVRDAVASIKENRVLTSLQTLERYRRQQGLPAMERIHLRHPDQGLIVTNLTRMPIGDVDFGSGPPVGFAPYVEISGGAAIVAAQDGLEIIFHGSLPPAHR